MVFMHPLCWVYISLLIQKGAAVPGVVLIAAAGRSGTFSAGQKLITAR